MTVNLRVMYLPRYYIDTDSAYYRHYSHYRRYRTISPCLLPLLLSLRSQNSIISQLFRENKSRDLAVLYIVFSSHVISCFVFPSILLCNIFLSLHQEDGSVTLLQPRRSTEQTRLSAHRSTQSIN